MSVRDGIFNDTHVVASAASLFSFELEPLPEDVTIRRVDCHLKSTAAGTGERECVGQIQITRSGRLIFQTETQLFGFNDSVQHDWNPGIHLRGGDVIGARGYVKNDGDKITLTAVLE